MFKFYSNCEFSGLSGTSWTSILALFISVGSTICTLLYLYIGKRVDIVSLKFQKFCILALDQILESFDEKLLKASSSVSGLQNSVTDLSTDLQLFLISLTEIYPYIKIHNMISVLEEFTDFVYKEKPTYTEVKQKFAIARLRLYSHLYDFALQNELSLRKRLARKANKKWRSRMRS